MVCVKLPLRKGIEIIPVLLDMRKIEMKRNFPITSGHKIIPSIKWKILRIVRGKTTSSYCRLCLTEKFFIINSTGDNGVFLKYLIKM